MDTGDRGGIVRPRPVVGKAAVPDAVRRLLDKFDYPDRGAPEQVVPILPTLGEGGGIGAFIHLARSATQSIDIAGEPISWDTAGVNGFAGFTETVPTTTVTIEQAGYYNVGIQFGWDSFTDGGTVTVLKNGVTVWPPIQDPGLWSATDGQLFEGTAHSIPCVPGDTLSVNIDPVSTETLESAVLAVYLVDQRVTVAASPWELVFEVDNYGVVWNGTHWWTGDDTDNVNPAMFQRDESGTVINSYAGWDTDATTRNRSICYDGTEFLYGVGGEEDVFQIDPSDGTTAKQFDILDGNTHIGVEFKGGNLWITEQDDEVIYEYSVAGAKLSTTAFPTGRTLWNIAWDGSYWWGIAGSDGLLRMDSSFSELEAVAGPLGIPISDGDLHHRNGFLYHMSTAGLWRRAI